MEPIKIILEIIIHTSGEVERKVRMLEEPPQVAVEVTKTPPKAVIDRIFIHCHRYFNDVGRKEHHSCKGCTVQCNLKEKYQGEPMIVKDGKMTIETADGPKVV